MAVSQPDFENDSSFILCINCFKHYTPPAAGINNKPDALTDADTDDSLSRSSEPDDSVHTASDAEALKPHEAKGAAAE